MALELVAGAGLFHEYDAESTQTRCLPFCGCETLQNATFLRNEVWVLVKWGSRGAASVGSSCVERQNRDRPQEPQARSPQPHKPCLAFWFCPWERRDHGSFYA